MQDCLTALMIASKYGVCGVVATLVLSLLVPCAEAHSSLIYPKPRNAIDSLLPEWSGGKAPYRWQPYDG